MNKVRQRRIIHTCTILLAAGLIATGCSGSSSKNTNPVYTSDKKTISVKSGHEFTIKIAGNETTPYLWQLSTKNFASDLVGIVKQSFVQNKSTKGEVGVGGNFVFIFKAKKPGNTKLVFNNVYIGTGSISDTKTYTVAIK